VPPAGVTARDAARSYRRPFPDDALRYAAAHAGRFEADLREVLRFPSVSGPVPVGGRPEALHRCAGWLAGRLRSAGLDDVRLVETGGPPLVLARSAGRRPRPHLLIYGHYDVVPPGPGWTTPPFRPTRRGDRLHARGAGDDKGQVMAHVAALESLICTGGRLPVTTTCLFEGEEEVGSPHLPAFLADHHRALAADLLVVSDTRMLGPGRPALVRSLRGAIAFDLQVSADRPALHSGRFGGAVTNPAQVLVALLARLATPQGRLDLPGLRAGRADPAVPSSDPAQRAAVLPACTVTALRAGRPGLKAVPNAARAELDVRLVAPQRLRDVETALRRQVDDVAGRHPELTVTFHTRSGSPPVSVPVDHPGTRAAAEALRLAFGTRPVLVRSGGSIPAVGHLTQQLGPACVLMGFGLPGDGAHAADEWLHLPTFHAAVRACIHLHRILGGARPA
jgi:acetylornithine deacetylase/succinyl-diaminopimelate desuccinylase-like protein